MVRRKLGAPENTDILLAQIRDNQTIDLDDGERLLYLLILP